MTRKTPRQQRTDPWERADPRPDGRHSHLSPQAKAAAKRRAHAAGRPYPNLVDNMRAAAAAKKRASAKRRER